MLASADVHPGDEFQVSVVSAVQDRAEQDEQENAEEQEQKQATSLRCSCSGAVNRDIQADRRKYRLKHQKSAEHNLKILIYLDKDRDDARSQPLQ